MKDFVLPGQEVSSFYLGRYRRVGTSQPTIVISEVGVRRIYDLLLPIYLGSLRVKYHYDSFTAAVTCDCYQLGTPDRYLLILRVYTRYSREI